MHLSWCRRVLRHSLACDTLDDVRYNELFSTEGAAVGIPKRSTRATTTTVLSSDRTSFMLLNSLQCPACKPVYLFDFPCLVSRKTDFREEAVGVGARRVFCAFLEFLEDDEACDDCERDRDLPLPLPLFFFLCCE